MTSETRTLIELTDILGIEFGCQKCGAKILYPFRKQYDCLAEYCPNCNALWFITAGVRHPTEPTTADEVKRVIASLRKIAESPLVLAQVRLCIEGLPKQEISN
jgi:hypothetical protein